jgi:excisionase family DNA binding protein
MALISVKDAARELGVSRGTLYALVRQQKIPYTRIGDRILLDVMRVRALFDFEPDSMAEGPSVVRTEGRIKRQ